MTCEEDYSHPDEKCADEDLRKVKELIECILLKQRINVIYAQALTYRHHSFEIIFKGVREIAYQAREDTRRVA